MKREVELTRVSDGGGKEEKNHPRLTESGHHFPEVAGSGCFGEIAPNLSAAESHLSPFQVLSDLPRASSVLLFELVNSVLIDMLPFIFMMEKTFHRKKEVIKKMKEDKRKPKTVVSWFVGKVE